MLAETMATEELALRICEQELFCEVRDFQDLTIKEKRLPSDFAK